MPKEDNNPPKAKQRTMTRVETNFVNLGDEHPTVEGTLAEKGSMTFNTGGQTSVVGRYKVVSETGVVQTVLGSTVMDDLLESVPVGTYIRLTFDGIQVTSSKMKVKKYILEVGA